MSSYLKNIISSSLTGHYLKSSLDKVNTLSKAAFHSSFVKFGTDSCVTIVASVGAAEN